ncbi:hypothetical protein STEG23_019522, partial [Scotinomys teguina]
MRWETGADYQQQDIVSKHKQIKTMGRRRRSEGRNKVVKCEMNVMNYMHYRGTTNVRNMYVKVWGHQLGHEQLTSEYPPKSMNSSLWNSLQVQSKDESITINCLTTAVQVCTSYLVEWIRKMWHMYTVEYYKAEKNNDIMKFAGKWMELENVILSESFQFQRMDVQNWNVFHIPAHTSEGNLFHQRLDQHPELQ